MEVYGAGGTHGRGKGNSRGLRRGVANADQAARNAAEEVLVRADAAGVGAAVANAAQKELVSALLLQW